MASFAASPADRAEEVRAVIGVPSNELRSYPLDLQHVVDNLGLKVYYATFNDPDISGMLITNREDVPDNVEAGEHGTIILKSGEYPKRSRFTLAHEIGHFCLGHHEDGVITDFFRGRASGYQDGRERDANEFAAELLMPRGIFSTLWESGMPEDDLGVLFGVSAAAVTVRAQALRLPTRYAY